MPNRINEIKPYDFRRPHQLGRLRIDSINLLFESFSRVAGNFLSTYLRAGVTLRHVGIEQKPFEDFVEGVASPCVIGLYSIIPDSSNLLLEMPSNLALGIIDRALGGPGYGNFPARELTDIEQAIMRRIFTRLGDLLAQSFGSVVSLQFQVEGIEFNPIFTQVAAADDLVITVQQVLEIDGRTEQVLWVWPFSSIDPIAEAIMKHGGGRDDLRVRVNPEVIDRHIAASPLRLHAVLGRTTISLGEFTKLQTGDVIILDRRYDDPLVVNVEGIDKFQALPGKHRGTYGLRIVSRLATEEP